MRTGITVLRKNENIRPIQTMTSRKLYEKLNRIIEAIRDGKGQLVFIVAEKKISFNLGSINTFHIIERKTFSFSTNDVQHIRHLHPLRAKNV